LKSDRPEKPPTYRVSDLVAVSVTAIVVAAWAHKRFEAVF
jgi:hypothetical protein